MRTGHRTRSAKPEEYKAVPPHLFGVTEENSTGFGINSLRPRNEPGKSRVWSIVPNHLIVVDVIHSGK